MRTGLTRVEVPRSEARAFHKHCQEHGVRIVHECPTAKSKTVFLCEGVTDAAAVERPRPLTAFLDDLAGKPAYEDDPTPDPELYKSAPIVEGYLKDDGAEPVSGLDGTIFETPDDT